MSETDFTMTVKELSELLECHPTTIYNWVKTLWMPHSRGKKRQLIFELGDVYKWVTVLSKNKSQCYLKYRKILHRYLACNNYWMYLEYDQGERGKRYREERGIKIGNRYGKNTR